VTRLIRSAV